MIAIKIDSVSKHYRQGMVKVKRALDNITLSINQGEIFGFLGPNGAGKTTLLKLITGLIVPTSGTITVFERQTTDSSVRSKIGFLPENPQFHRHLTAEEFLTCCGELFSLDHAQIKKRINFLLKLLEIDEARHQKLNTFSKGMLQRLGLAQALLNDPQLLILDEPLSGLDPLGRKMVNRLLLTMKQGGKTILFSSHILSDVENICDRVAILSAGTLLKVDSVKNLVNGYSSLQSHSLEDIFIEEVMV